MSVRIVRLKTPRGPDEGLRIGTVRRPPRGVRKADYAARDYFDVWLPELAPSAPLVSWALSEPFTPQRWAVLSASLSARDAATGRATSHYITGCAVVTDEFFRWLLL